MHDERQRLAQAGATRKGKRVVLARVLDRLLAAQDLAHDLDELVRTGKGFRKGLTVPALHDLRA